jgi:CubicO group peptidase (beta-lactamase class C family)
VSVVFNGKDELHMRRFETLLFLAAVFQSSGAGASDLPTPAEIDAEAIRLMTRADVKGMAIAVIGDGEAGYVAAYGLRSVEDDLPLETDTVMYGASLTKTAFAYMVLQLVDEKLLDLDAPLESYLPRPLPDYDAYRDLDGDGRWQALTARHVLNHSTGFHNFRWLEDDRVLRFHFQPGERYAYSGEGFNLLQFVLEQGLGLDVKAEMQRRVFDRFGMTNTSMQWREDFADNLADGYAMDGSFEPHDERSNVRAAGSMDTTIADQARLWAGVLAGDGLSAESRSELVQSQLPILTARQFPSLIEARDPRGPEIGLAAGTGLVTFDAGQGKTWFKGGHNDWTGNMVVCQERVRRCVVLLANSVRAELIYPDMVRFVLGETGMPWWWEYGLEE